jgi:hypothetical protein
MNKLLSRFLVILWMTCMVAGCSGLNERIQGKIETEGSQLTGVSVDVAEVDLKVLAGQGQITGITVANPDGYGAKNAFEMDLLRLNIGFFSLLGSPLVLEELVIDGPVVNLEMNPRGGSNLKVIRENIEEYLKEADRKSKEGKTETYKTDKDPRRIKVDRLVIRGADFNLQRKDGSIHSGTLPDIELADVGGSEGKTLGGISSVVIIAITKEMFSEELFGKIKETLEAYRPVGEGDNFGTFVADKVVGALDQRLELTGGQQDILKVVIELAVLELHKTLGDEGGLGLLDNESLPNQLAAIAQSVQLRLVNELDEEQKAEVRAFFDDLAAEVTEMIREALFSRVARFLDLTAEQMEEFRPVFDEELAKWSLLLRKFADTYQSLVEEYVVLKGETSQNLEELLNEDQMKALIEREGAMGELIRLFLSPGN